MNVYDKLSILSASAKYDVACTSSGVDRSGRESGSSMGSAASCGICHSFAADGRCISLLKVLMTNYCVYDCKYCVNRRSNDVRRTAFTPEELAELTMNFYRRNYIEGLFLSSGVLKNANYTTEQMLKVLQLLRNEYRFGGYIHVKAIPGVDAELIARVGTLADRMSVNIEMPSEDSLNLLCPDKSRDSILRPMGLLTSKIQQSTTEIVKYRHAPQFVPAGQSTQMIVGATPDTDHKILTLSEALYKKYSLRRVFYSAYMPVVEHSLLPSVETKPPLLREHRLYQADWLLRFYGFEAKELLDDRNPNFNLLIDPKCNWAINHMEHFPIEVNRAPYEMLLRVPGIGVKSAQRILVARRTCTLDFSGLKKIGVVLKRAQYFLTCKGKIAEGLKITQDGALRALMSDRCANMLPAQEAEQLSLFSGTESVFGAAKIQGILQPTREDLVECLTGQM